MKKATKQEFVKLYSGLRYVRPLNIEDMRNYIKIFFNVDIPHSVVDNHQSAIEYMWFSFNRDFVSEHVENGDCVIWANRGGGKTQLAGLLTLLDCIFKPNIQIRILSGSGYQAGRMYDYFSKYLRMGFESQIKDIKRSPADKVIFKNNATVEVLKQSETMVRGEHVHKLRCDEVELFKTKVFEAAQYTTMSSDSYVAALEVISTMHRKRGLMESIIKESEKLNRKVFKWNLWDVIEKCERDNCDTCVLKNDCNGIAKRGNGFYKVDDAITQYNRSKPASFLLEMLCCEGSKKKSFWNFKSRLY